ncbi:GlxA family transcriptional regulator (plasmid) [Rhizobium leguminosarum]|jgi:transcriptional regulator GlxA family with amidase domain
MLTKPHISEPAQDLSSEYPPAASFTASELDYGNSGVTPTAVVRNIDFIIYPGALLLDLAGPIQVFELANRQIAPGQEVYRITIRSVSGGLVRTSSGVEVNSVPIDRAAKTDTLIVAGGFGVHKAAEDVTLITWLAKQKESARRICSVCTGAFALASAGLLDHRQVVTHWRYCDLLQEQYPSTMVIADAIYLHDDQIWTSAGVTTGIDLALALIEEDYGRRMAMDISRELVVFLKRSGGQMQYSVPLRLQMEGDGSLDSLYSWIQANLNEDLSVEALAAKAGMSPRTFARVFSRQTGRTPAKTVELLRLETARRLLEESSISLKEIAVRCGFLEEDRMRRSFLRSLGISPQTYRARFG